MATQSEIEALYDWVHPFHTLRSGDHADFSCAFFDGNFSQTLIEAQKAKHQWVLEGIGFRPPDRILDVGSGWGPMLDAVRRRGGKSVGLTLSSAQADYCAAKGLKVFLQDWKTVDPSTLGALDGVISIGAFEHFCSIDEYIQGAQDRIYRDFFAFCSQVLPAGGKLFLQTMTWGQVVPDPRKLSLSAPQGSPERILARLTRFYPGSWLPASRDQIVAAANEHFDFLYSNNGRLDYIETLNRWGQSTANLFKPSRLPKALWAAARLFPRFCGDSGFRTQIESLRRNDQQVCFLKKIMSHERMFFEKKLPAQAADEPRH
jgi:cyclopropane-fatty-acyl-phospholipid synthase